MAITSTHQDNLDAAAMATASTLMQLMRTRGLTRDQAIAALIEATGDEDTTLALLDRARLIASTALAGA